jgi:hypothetical protein
MKVSLQVLISIAMMALVACSTQEIKQDAKSVSVPNKPPEKTDRSGPSSEQNPAMTLTKGDKTLHLVRIMDGGACKNDFQGAKGTFLIYADSEDIERIKRDKGPQIFNNFEKKIQSFSTTALQNAVNTINLAEDPFSLDADQAQEKLSKQLVNYFHNSIADDINTFQKTTTLTIDVVPFSPSLIFYQQGCEALRLDADN